MKKFFVNRRRAVGVNPKKSRAKQGTFLICALLLINFSLTASTFADAPNSSLEGTRTPIENLQQIGEGTNLPAFDATGQHPDAAPEYDQPGAGTLTSPVLFVIDIMRFLGSTIAVLVVIISAAKLLGDPTEENGTKAKTHMQWAVVGLILIQFADVLVRKMFFGDQGEAFSDAGTSQLFATESVSQIRGIVGLIEIFVGVIAVLVIIVRGFSLITSAGEEEALTKAKSQLLWAVGGLLVVGLSEVVVRGFLFPANGESLPDQAVGKTILVSVTNFVASFVAILSFASLFYAGYQYVTSGGNEEVNEKVKKIATGAVIGLLLSLGAYALVNTFVTLEARPDQPAQESPQEPISPIVE